MGERGALIIEIYEGKPMVSKIVFLSLRYIRVGVDFQCARVGNMVTFTRLPNKEMLANTALENQEFSKVVTVLKINSEEL